MKTIAISQRLETSKFGELRAQLDIKIFEYVVKAGFIPLPIPYFHKDKKNKNLEDWIKTNAPSGLILSGGEDIGKYKLRDNSEIFLINYCKKKKIPIFAICRGMQLISVLGGSKLFRVKNRVNKIVKIIYDKKIRKVILFHKFSISKCPKNFIITSKSNSGLIESIFSKKLKILCIMWHPERENPIRSFNINLLKNFFNK